MIQGGNPGEEKKLTAYLWKEKKEEKAQTK